MLAWRIASDTPDFTADDLSGLGAQRYGGRWNRAGEPLVYCADSPALACLETLVHLGGAGLPLNRYLVAVHIPDDLWQQRESIALAELPVGWDTCPPGKVSLDFGDAWLKSKRSAILTLPSAIVPENQVILISPSHPQASPIRAEKRRKWLYDPRVG